MQEIAVQILFGLLRQLLNKEVIAKYQAELIACLRDAVNSAPAVLKGAETQICCHLLALAKKTDNKLDDQAVKLVADALGVDLSACENFTGLP